MDRPLPLLAILPFVRVVPALLYGVTLPYAADAVATRIRIYEAMDPAIVAPWPNQYVHVLGGNGTGLVLVLEHLNAGQLADERSQPPDSESVSTLLAPRPWEGDGKVRADLVLDLR